MISNDQDSAIVSRQLQDLRVQRDQLLGGKVDGAFQTHVEVAGIEKMIARLQDEIDAYSQSKAKLASPVASASQ